MIQYQCLFCYHLWQGQSLADSLSNTLVSLSSPSSTIYILVYLWPSSTMVSSFHNFFSDLQQSKYTSSLPSLLHHSCTCYQPIDSCMENHTRHLYIAAVRCVSEIRHFFLFIIGYFMRTYVLYLIPLNYNFEKLILYFVVESRIFTAEKVQKERQQYQRSFIATRPLLGMDQKGYSLIKYRV